jgi:lipopolysaccharide transport system ATP-binding protein
MRQTEVFSTPAMSGPAITIENLSKRYTIDHQRSNRDGLRHVVESAIRAPLAWLRSGRQRKMQRVDFWALKDVSFQIRPGEVVGIVGRNGAGKSTLLKILSRITLPTEGRIRIDGRTASLLEVGTGFHQELTGRENIFLNGAILGMTRAEILRKFDEIVEFSGIEEFLDTPVKRYSSGMYVRLAFAVAAHLEPEILIVDEVLAVGDAAFQKKCLGKMETLAQSGRTVLFVSHNMDAVRTLCERAILLGEGRIQADGNAENVVEDYFARLSTSSGPQLRGAHGLTIENVVLKNDGGQETRQFCPGEDLIIEIKFDAQECLERPCFVLVVRSNKGICFTANMILDGHRPRVLNGKGLISCRFKSIPLLPQRYTVQLAIKASDGRGVLMEYEDVGSFIVKADLLDYGYKGEFQTRASEATAVVIPYEWQLPDGTTAIVSLNAPASTI